MKQLTDCQQNMISINRSQIKSWIQRLTCIAEQGNMDASHNIDHFIKVTTNGLLAIQSCPKVLDYDTRLQIVLACLFHDADDQKYFPTHTNHENTRSALTDLGVASSSVSNIVGMIAQVSYSSNADTIDQQKPQWWYYPRYCDRIEAIGYRSLLRAYSYSIKVNNPIFVQKTPTPLTIEELYQSCEGRSNQYQQRGGTSISMVDHIFDKLIHIKLPTEITNKYLQSKFKQAHQQIVNFTLQNARSSYKDVEKQMKKLKQCQQHNNIDEMLDHFIQQCQIVLMQQY